MTVGVPRCSLYSTFIHRSMLRALDSPVCQFEKNTVLGTVYKTRSVGVCQRLTEVFS